VLPLEEEEDDEDEVLLELELEEIAFSFLIWSAVCGGRPGAGTALGA